MLSAPRSAYERERDERIEANNAILKSLGLDNKPALVDKRPKPTPAPKKRRYEDDPEYVTPKRETRSSGRSAAIKDSDSSSDGDEYAVIPRPVKAPKKRPAEALPAASTGKLLDESINMEGKCIVVEEAKTGRSKCRKCLEALPAGAVRVGMESWIVGRNVMTWQHPDCFLSGLEITLDSTGRSKCKQTKEKFLAGERRLSASAHTTTNNFKLSVAAALLRPVFHAVSSTVGGQRAAFEGIARLSELQKDERELLAQALTATEPTPSNFKHEPETSTDAVTVKSEPAIDVSIKQPAIGQVSKAKGRVCWRFAGCLCYGTLLPAQETKTTCYARTHKGNTKTLTKGSASWWMLDD